VQLDQNAKRWNWTINVSSKRLCSKESEAIAAIGADWSILASDGGKCFQSAGMALPTRQIASG
jgi:hypothetical protein